MLSRVAIIAALSAVSGNAFLQKEAKSAVKKTHVETVVKSQMRLLNDPEQKIETRIDTLRKLKKRMKSFEMNGLLADQQPFVADVMTKIDSVLKMSADGKKKSKGSKEEAQKQKDTLDKAIQDVQASVNELKARFMKKVMDLQEEQKARMAELNTGMGKSSATAEQLFDKLLEAQDAPLKEQLAILVPAAEKNDKFVMKFLKKHGYEMKDGEVVEVKDADSKKSKHFEEGANLAMEFGKALDTKKEDEDKEENAEELEKLEKSAKLKESQAKNLLPILQKIKGQQEDKKVKIHDVEKKLAELEDTERFYKKHKANLKREDHVLGEAVDAIEHGKIKKLTKAMDELRQMSH